MTRLTVSKAKTALSDVVDRAAKTKERTVLSRRGKSIAAVVPIEDLRLLEHLTQEEMDRQDIEGKRARRSLNAENASRCASSCANSGTDLAYSLELTPAAQRDLHRLDPPVRKKINEELLALEKNPRPIGAERLHAKEKLHRFALGPKKNYRAVY